MKESFASLWVCRSVTICSLFTTLSLFDIISSYLKACIKNRLHTRQAITFCNLYSARVAKLFGMRDWFQLAIILNYSSEIPCFSWVPGLPYVRQERTKVMPYLRAIVLYRKQKAGATCYEPAQNTLACLCNCGEQSRLKWCWTAAASVSQTRCTMQGINMLL